MKQSMWKPWPRPFLASILHPAFRAQIRCRWLWSWLGLWPRWVDCGPAWGFSQGEGSMSGCLESWITGLAAPLSHLGTSYSQSHHSQPLLTAATNY